MTKERFLGNLEYALNFMQDEEREATLNFYAEMIDDRMEDGLTEDEAVAQMEKPDTIVQRLKKMQDAPADKAAAKEPEPAPQNKTEKKTEQEKTQELPKDWEMRVVTYPAASVSSIEIQSSNLPLHLTKAENDEISLTYFTCEFDPYTVSLEDGALALAHRTLFSSNKDFFGNVSDLVNNLAQMFSGKVTFESPSMGGAYIDLAVPASYVGSINLGGSNARVRVDDITCRAGLTVHTSNGRISVNQVACDFIDLQTSNSRVSVDDSKTRADIRLKSTNGRLEVKDSIAFGSIQLTTSNGAINVEDIACDDIALKTSNGAITGNIKGKASDYAIQSETCNGHNSLPNGTQGEKRLSVRTSNGSIRVKFDE